MATKHTPIRHAIPMADTVRLHLQACVEMAASIGMVVRIEQVPLKPWASGHTKTVIHLDPKRHKHTSKYHDPETGKELE